MAHRLRLVKVLVQAVFVEDDGEHLQELVTDPVEVAATEWLSFPAGRFEDLRAQAELDLQRRGPDEL
jgi:hypothetical protein